MFGTATNEAIPAAYLTDYAAWDQYMANVWQPLLERFGVAHAECIVEVAPGPSSKIGLALSALDYSGALLLIEPDASIGATIAARYQALMPRANVVLITKKLGEAGPEIAYRPDLILANHPLDDMLLAVQASSHLLSQLFGGGLAEDGNIADEWRTHWAHISSHSERLEAAMQAVFAEWSAAIDAMKPKGIVVSQYGSSALKNADMDDLNASAKSILRRLQDTPFDHYRADTQLQPLLNRNKHYSNHYIGTEVLNARHWWAMRRVV